MATTLSYTHLDNSSAMFDQMIRRFGVVTVMNAHVYPFDKDLVNDSKKADAIIKQFVTYADGEYSWKNSITVGSGATSHTIDQLCVLDTLKVANVTEEGPTKTVTGGQYANPLIKFGKTARLEMQDALGNAPAIEALCGGLVEGTTLAGLIGDHTDEATDDIGALHFGTDFAGPKTIIGESFFIDQKSGQQVKVIIAFYQFQPDSIFNLTQDAEGDATVFDMNGDLLATNIKVSTKTENQSVSHGVFYSVIDPALLTA